MYEAISQEKEPDPYYATIKEIYAKKKIDPPRQLT
jgi:hypothetical protein